MATMNDMFAFGWIPALAQVESGLAAIEENDTTLIQDIGNTFNDSAGDAGGFLGGLFGYEKQGEAIGSMLEGNIGSEDMETSGKYGKFYDLWQDAIEKNDLNDAMLTLPEKGREFLGACVTTFKDKELPTDLTQLDLHALISISGAYKAVRFVIAYPQAQNKAGYAAMVNGDNSNLWSVPQPDKGLATTPSTADAQTQQDESGPSIPPPGNPTQPGSNTTGLPTPFGGAGATTPQTTVPQPGQPAQPKQQQTTAPYIPAQYGSAYTVTDAVADLQPFLVASVADSNTALHPVQKYKKALVALLGSTDEELQAIINDARKRNRIVG